MNRIKELFNKAIKWYEQEWYYGKWIVSGNADSYLVKYLTFDGGFGLVPSFYSQYYDGHKLNRLRLFVVSIEWGHVVYSKNQWEKEMKCKSN
ncbi:hypothetical protein [Aeromonas phage L9-6]|nr:hypothetical protein [Aeromonas phage L9-6]